MARTETEFQKNKACDFIADAGLSFHLGQAEDGTAFDYIDESFRDLPSIRIRRWGMKRCVRDSIPV